MVRIWGRNFLLFCVVGLLVFSSFSFIACSDDDDDDDDNNDSSSEIVMPLTVGNTWTYAITQSPTGTGSFTMTVASTEFFSCGEVARINYTGDLYTTGYYIWLRNEQGLGLYFWGDEFWGQLDTPDLWCKNPTSVGDTWQTSGQGGVVNWVVVSTSQTVTTAAGTFNNCIEIQGSPSVDPQSIATHFWALGVGEVKATLPSLGLTWELQSYSVQ